MSISSQITRLTENVSDALDAIQAKGVEVPAGSNSDDLATLISLISTGGGGVVVTETPDEHGGTIVEITGEELILQSKSATPTTSSQLIQPDEGYNGLSSVRLNAIPSEYIIPTGNKTLTENGTNIDIAQYASVTVNVPSSGGGGTLQEKTGIVPTESSQTISPDEGYYGLSSVQIDGISSTYVGSGVSRNSSSDLTASGATVTVPSGYYETEATKTISSGTAGTPTASKGTVTNHSVSVTPTVTNTAGYISGGTKTGTAVTVSASELVSGTKQITANGSNIDVTNYEKVTVAVPGDSPSLQQKVGIDPTESDQTITFDEGYDGLELVQINAISSSYIGSDVPQKSSSDLTVSGATVNVPSGYYSEAASKSVSSMTLPTSTSSSATTGYTSKATVSRSTSDQYINIPTGYNSSGAYYKINAVPNGSVTAPSTISGSSATVSTGTNTLTLSKSVSVTPNVTTAGYISSGTAGNSSVSLTASVTTQAAKTVTPTESEQTAVASNVYTTGVVKVGAIPSTYVGSGIATRSSSDLTVSGGTVTAPAGYYSSSASKTVSSMTLPTSASSSATSGYTSKATIGRSTSNQYINIPAGYNSSGAYYLISAVPNGSATGPSSLSGTSATVSTGNNTLTLTKTNVTTTPTVTAGYVSGAIASSATVTLTANITTKSAETFTPSTTNQTISSGTYLTGTQTIQGDANLVGANILSGVSIFGVSGQVTFQTYYTGSSAPSSSLGNNGDIYLQA